MIKLSSSYLNRNIYKGLTCFFLFFTVAFQATADENSTRFTDTKISKVEMQRANLFGLNETEWKAYKNEMKGPRAMWSPDLHPLAVLGMRKGVSQNELKRLARKMAIINYERVKRELAFEHAVRAEGQKLFSKLPIFKTESDIQKVSGSLRRIKYYSKSSCKECKKQVKRWIERGTHFDAYILGNEKEIQNWAKDMGISPMLVLGRQITLNQVSTTDLNDLNITSLPKVVR